MILGEVRASVMTTEIFTKNLQRTCSRCREAQPQSRRSCNREPPADALRRRVVIEDLCKGGHGKSRSCFTLASNAAYQKNAHAPYLYFPDVRCQVMSLLAEALGVTERVRPMDDPPVFSPAEGSVLEGCDMFAVPFCAKTGDPSPSSTAVWDLRPGGWVRLTGGPYEGDYGQIVGKNSAGHWRIRFSVGARHFPRDTPPCPKLIPSHNPLSPNPSGVEL